MILYFDNLITDIPLFPGAYSELDSIRDSDSNYKFVDRLKVTMYTLLSYAEYPWSEVVIKYQLDPEDDKQKKEFEKFVRGLWPKAHISYGRSDNIHKFRESAKLINSFNDDWIFFAIINDHPFMFPNLDNLNKSLERAEKLRKKYPYVSIQYSHYPEPLHMARKGVSLHDIGFPDSRILEETEDYVVGFFPNEYFSSSQIITKNILNRWLFSKDISKDIDLASIKKIESIYPFIKKNKRKPQLVILPKKEVCAHFDGYSHTRGTGYVVPSSLLPPLFIPPGFFEKNIKIAYGYEDYRKGWVNVNPLKKKFSFEDSSNGTDLKITLEDLPLFWKKRISKVDINKNADVHKLKIARNLRFQKIRNLYFTRNTKNFLFYEAYIYQFRIRNLIKRLISTNEGLKKKMSKFEINYGIKL